MKLKPDCIRDVLLYLEDNLEYENNNDIVARIDDISWTKLYKDEKLSSKYEIADIKYSIQKLHEVRFIEAQISTGSGKGWVTCNITDITWNGHEFLNTIRGQTIWEATKKQSVKLGGASIRMLGAIATSITQAVVTNPTFIQKIVDTII